MTRPDNVFCFIDKGRPCKDTCMAFVHTSMGDRLKQCGILVVGNKLFEAASSAIPQTKAAYPESAPPPKVHT
jgi:hypothetical protein